MVPLSSDPREVTPFISRVLCSREISFHLLKPSFCGEEGACSSERQRGHQTCERWEENEAIKPPVGFLTRKVPLFALSLALRPRHDQRPLGQEACPLYGLLMDFPSCHLTKCPSCRGGGSPKALLLVYPRTPPPSLTP